MNQYLGTEFLAVLPDASASADFPQGQRRRTLDAGTGIRAVVPQDDLPYSSRQFPWVTTDRAEAAALRRFIVARAGRRTAFWVPSWRQDLELAAPAGGADSSIDIVRVGYSVHLWPGSGARRHLALCSHTSQFILRRVVSATDNGDGSETLELLGPNGEGSLGTAVGPTWLVMFLRLCRLDSDDVLIKWDGIVGSAVLTMRELPLEAPL